MKPKSWAIVLAVVLLALVIPVPTGTWRDGGTRTYTALTYKIVDWNYAWGEDQVYDETKVYLFPKNFQSLDTLLPGEEAEITPVKGEETTAPGETQASEQPGGFSARCIRTNGRYDASRSYPVVTVIHSAEELRSYYQANRYRYDLSARGLSESGEPLGFLDACDGYDEDFFESKGLILVTLQESSGSVRHEVTKVEQTGDTLCLWIRRKAPEIGTCDMAQWHILIELDHPVTAQNVQIQWEGQPTTTPVTQPTNPTK